MGFKLQYRIKPGPDEFCLRLGVGDFADLATVTFNALTCGAEVEPLDWDEGEQTLGRTLAYVPIKHWSAKIPVFMDVLGFAL